jgi:putative nucleotidyltransferase with HDIG domain
MSAGSTPAVPTRVVRIVATAHRALLVLSATAAVTVLPVLGARAFRVATGLDSFLFSVGIGIALSVALSRLGTWMWSTLAVSEDLVFGDLMLWGWIRRSLSEQSLARATRRLGLDGKGWAPDSELAPEEQARVLQDLAVALERRDAYTHGHTNRVTRFAFAIAREMGLDPATVENIRVAASVHDVGKMNIPLKIINKPGALTDEEYDVIKQHSAIGAAMVERLGNPEITAMVRHHHERLDGRGYPDRLAGGEIPLGARIIAVADTFDAVCSNRSYRKASKHKTALEILRKASGTQLDRAAVDAFITYYSGRGTFEWRAVMTTIPQRLIEWMGRSVPGGVVQGATAAVAAVSIAASPITLVPGVLRLKDAADRVTASHLAGTEQGAASGESEAGAATGGNDAANGGNRADDDASGRDAASTPALDTLPGEIAPVAGAEVPGDDSGDTAGSDPGSGDAKDSTSGAAPSEESADDAGSDTTDPSAGDDGTSGGSDPGSGPDGGTNGPTDPVGDVTDPITDPTDPITDTDPGTVTDPIEDILEPPDLDEPIGGVDPI